HALSTFRPSTVTESKPPVPAAASNLLGTVVPVVMREKLCYAIHLVNGRVIGVERQFHTCLFSHREHRLHKVCVVRPDLICRMLALVLLILYAIPEIVQVELAPR